MAANTKSHRGGAVMAGCAIAAVLVVAGCAQPESTDPAPSASDPVCAQLLLTLPTELGGQPQRSTTSQASRAWGDPAIVLRCGVQPLAPTADGCLGVTASNGREIGWVVQEDDEQTTFTTYGLLPAVQVTVPADYAGDQSIIVDLTEAATLLEQDGDRSCL